MEKELKTYLKNTLPVTTKFNLKLELVHESSIIVSSGLSFEHGKGYKGELRADPVPFENFTEAYNLKNLKRFETMEQGNLWIRYIIGKAAVSYKVPELQATVCFRIVNSKTIIYSKELCFYDESETLFTMEKAFEQYLKDNMARLGWLAARKHPLEDIGALKTDL